MRNRVLSVTAGVAALTLGGLLVASPASAATLPDGAHLTIAAQYLVEQGSEGPEASQLLRHEPRRWGLNADRPRAGADPRRGDRRAGQRPRLGERHGAGRERGRIPGRG